MNEHIEHICGGCWEKNKTIARLRTDLALSESGNQGALNRLHNEIEENKELRARIKELEERISELGGYQP